MPTSLPRTAVFAAGALLLGLLAGAGCSSDEADSTTAVTGTDDACRIEPDVLDAGKIDFEFTNEAGKVSELYVLNADGDVMSEVENVTTGSTRSLTVDLVAGDYRVTCKPGQTGDGFSSDFTVTGEGGTATPDPDRTVTFDAVDFTYEDLDLSGISADDTIRFEMTNSGDQPHELEILDPAGDAIGEVAAVDAGESGGATLTFEAAGTYTFQCILVDAESQKEHTELGMTGTFDVAA